MCNKGFSLFEVLIALALTAIMLGVLIGGTFTESQRLDDALVDMEKAVRFSADEAILRNKIIRIHFQLDKNPQEYAVEYGPSSSFVLPAFVADKEGDEGLSLEEEEKRTKEKAAFDKKFNPVQEFEEGAQGLPDTVKIVAVGTDLQQKLILDGNASLYVYPTGQKDGAIIFLGTSEEVVALKISPSLLILKKST